MKHLTSNFFKRWLTVLSLVGGITLGANADSVEVDGLYYELNTSARTATLTYESRNANNYANLPASVSIPENISYNGVSFSVTTIANEALANCTSLESISIPGSVTSIGTASTSSSYLPFYNCSSLKTIRFEDGEKPIELGSYYYSSGSGSGLFYSCPLEEVYIGRNIQYANYSSSYKFGQYPERYGYSAFYNQSKLAKVTIGEKVTDIPAYLFYNNESITLMTFPKVENIGKAAFRGCTKLTTLNLGTQLTTVADQAFYGCSNVTKLTFPNTTKTIGESAFYNCSSVTEVTVGTGLNSIGTNGFYGCESFTALILPDTFTTMGESAFEGCKKLTIAKIGTSVTKIPAKAFKGCISLSEMVVPASALSIDDQAFYNCSGLATITMNEGLVTIGNEVFWNNSGIMQFSIPGTVTKMGRNCFYGCTRTSYLTFRDGEETLAIDNSGTHSSIIDAKTSNSSYTNRYYDYFYDCPIRFLTLGRNLTYSSTNNQSMYDFDGSSFNSVSRASAPFVNKTELRSVTIGPKVTFLYNHLFDGCINITKLSFPAGLTSVYSYALANCDGLTALDFPEQVISLGSCVCENDINLESVLFREEPNNNLSFTIGSWGFSNCPKLTTLTFPAKTTSIGHFCFANDISLKELIFTDSPKTLTLGSGALNQSVPDYNIGFFGNSRLESLYIGRNITYTASPSYGYSPFYNQQFLTDVRFSQAGTVTFCHDYLLYGVNNCKELILPESLQTIGSRTFANMTILEGITIPNKVTEIGTYAFSEDKTLKYAKLSTSCPWLKEGLFNSCDSLESIFIPAIVTKMDTRMFANCKSLASATFEGNSDILEMGYGASNSNYGLFRDCPLETLNLDRWITYDTNQPSYAPFYSIKELKNLSLGENVGIIDKYMFAYCTGLEELYLPDTIESVGLWGFRGCSSLKKVRFSEKLSQVSDFGFSECTSLDNVIFPASMTSIADNSFSNCTSLKTLDLGKSLMIIGPSAFKNDGALEGIEIPETLYGLGVEAFANCTSLPYVAIKAISSVGRQAFEGCTGLQWVSLSEKTTSLGENSFAGCSDIKYIKSYAQLPPEGLVNFVESVPENGTLFVPESSLDYYQYSPTWENWLDIRPLNDNVLVSSITLDKSEISFKATDTATLSVTVGADDATDKEIIWRTSDEQIASVDNDGIVTAIAVGEAIITALAADGSGIKAECKVTVNPTLVESIAINSATSSLKKGRTLELSASVAPATATNQEIIWSSSNPSIATVDDKGNVTAISAGDVNILATAADESGMDTLYALSVVPPTKGDSNDNDAVTITDAVNTANYAVGNEVENFCFEGADVNEDNKITLADASGTISIILDTPPMSTASKARALSQNNEATSDMLTIDDFDARRGETVAINIGLNDTQDYVALQADLVLPQGLSLVSVDAGDRIVSHKLITKQIDNNITRIILFDPDNSSFRDGDDSFLTLKVKVKESQTGDIVLNNIFASDAGANEYILTSTGGRNINVSRIWAVKGNVKVFAEGNEIKVNNAEGYEVTICDIDGAVISHFTAKSNTESVNVEAGIYIVKVGALVEKIIIK